MLVSFNIFDEFKNLSQELFSIAREYESVKEAMIPTGDEFFLSLAIDNYVRLEKCSYFSVLTERKPEKIIEL